MHPIFWSTKGPQMALMHILEPQAENVAYLVSPLEPPDIIESVLIT